jgi:adenylyltransferase/sulfurtransferase
MDVYTLAVKLKAGEPVYLLDVRTPAEHAIAALPGSQLIPLAQLAARAGEVRPGAGATVVVYCHHGIRSRAAADLLARLGHSSACSLAGGIDAWSVLIDPQVPRY